MPMTETQIYSIEDQLSTLINLIQSSNVPAFPANQYPNNGAGLPNSVSSQETNMAVDQEGPMSTDAGMPDDVVAAAVDTYFDYCHNQPYSFFHEAHFRRRLSEKTVPTHLLLSIIATAARFCSHPYFAGRVHEASVECANRAWKLIVADCFTGGTEIFVHCHRPDVTHTTTIKVARGSMMERVFPAPAGRRILARNRP